MNNEQNKELQTFEHELFGGIRAIIKDGSPWFIAVDVCRCLDHSNPRKAISHLKENQVSVTIGYTKGGKRQMNIISESGLYALIFKSRKPEALEFQDWVCEEVLPSIRKTGGYSISADSMQLQLDILESRIRSLEMDKEVANAPVRRLSISEFRKHLIDRYPYLTNIEILNALCERGILYIRDVLLPERSYWATEYAIREGLFEVEIESCVTKKGEKYRFYSLFITVKGLDSVHDALRGK